MFKWARANKLNVNTKNKLSNYYKTASQIDTSRCRAEVSHLAGFFVFINLNWFTNLPRIVTSHWHQMFRIVPFNRVIVFPCMLRQSRFIELVFEATILVLFLPYFQTTACLTNMHLSSCTWSYGIPRALSLYLFCLYVYIGFGRFFY